MIKSYFGKSSLCFGPTSQSRSREICFQSLTRCARKRKQQNEQKIIKEKNGLTLAAYATADCYSLEGLLKAVKSEKRFVPSELTTDFTLLAEVSGALHVRLLPCDADSRHVYFFDVGAVAMWNLTYNQRDEILELLKQFEERPYKYSVVQSSSELLCYKETKCNSSYLHDNTLYFGVAEKDASMIGLNRFLISSVISLSSKVSAFESMFEEHLARIEEVASNMKKGKRLGISYRQILATAGLSYSVKYALNHSTASLLQPLNILEQFRSVDEQESMANTYAYFKLPMRLKVFDDNLQLCDHYSNLLFQHFSHRQTKRFQNVIICFLVIGMLAVAWKMFKTSDTE